MRLGTSGLLLSGMERCSKAIADCPNDKSARLLGEAPQRPTGSYFVEKQRPLYPPPLGEQAAESAATIVFSRLMRGLPRLVNPVRSNHHNECVRQTSCHGYFVPQTVRSPALFVLRSQLNAALTAGTATISTPRQRRVRAKFDRSKCGALETGQNFREINRGCLKIPVNRAFCLHLADRFET